MNEILQKIDEIISREHDFRVQAVGGTYFLEEPKEPNYSKTIIKQRGKMLMLKLDVEDSNKIIFPFFDSSMNRLTQICDYIIFYPKEDTLFVFLCEQKTSQSSAKYQVEAGLILAEFIVRMAQRMLKFQTFNVEYRALVFSLSDTSRHQQTSKVKKDNDYAILGDSFLKNKLIRAGGDCYLDNLCF
jgi:hypothetical protein